MPHIVYRETIPTTESATYVGLDLLQEQTRVKALRRGFVFNLMVVGRSGLGKSTMIDTLFKSRVSPKEPGHHEPIPSTTQIRTSSRNLSEGGVNLILNIVDTPGFGDHVNNENCWEPLVKYIETQQVLYLKEEQRIDRPRRITDTRVHCCLYFIQPTGHELSSLDIEVLKRLETVVNVIPVIAKADTMTIEERILFKSKIREDFEHLGIKTYPSVHMEDKEDLKINNKIRENSPFAVVGSTVWHDLGSRKALGRKTCCGLVEVENKSHNDFPLLRDLLIRTHMEDLIVSSASHFYENFRQKQLEIDLKTESKTEDKEKQ